MRLRPDGERCGFNRSIAHLLRGCIGRAQCLFKIFNQIRFCLKADREPEKAFSDPSHLPCFSAHPEMRHRRRMRYKAFYSAKNSASVKARSASTNRRTAVTPPASSKLSMAPNPDCCAFARAWPGADGRPG